MFLAVPRRLRSPQCSLLLCLSVALLLLAAVYVSTVRDNVPESRRVGVQDEAERPFNYPQPEVNVGDTVGDEVIYRYVDSDDLHAYQTPEGSDSSPTRPLTRQELKQLTYARAAALRHLGGVGAGSSLGGVGGGKWRYLGGRYRWLAEGVEYDLSFGEPGREVTTRLTLFQRLEPTPRVVRTLKSNDRLVVNIVVALKGRTDKFSVFLDHLVVDVLPREPNLTLTVVYFADAAAETAREAARRALSAAPGIEWSFVPIGGDGTEAEPFSRGRGLDAGVEEVVRRRRRKKEVSDAKGQSFGVEEEEEKVLDAKGRSYAAEEVENGVGDLLFFCDVDVLPKAEFFRRCRANAVEGRQAYFPVLFSLYNPRLVRPLEDGDPPPPGDPTASSGADRLEVSALSGFWREFGYGMACVFASDYQAAGGFPDLHAWGGEDEALFERLQRVGNIKVLRAPDPGLFHLYHRKDCTASSSTSSSSVSASFGFLTSASSSSTSSSYPACLKSKALNEGSRLQLGLALLRLREGADVEGILSKRFYYFWLVPYLAGFLVLSLAANVFQAAAAVVSARRRRRRSVVESPAEKRP